MPKRKINKIIVHCSATPSHMDIGVNEIRAWHLERGWSDIGYHNVIRRSGRIEEGRDVEKAGAHTLGHNKDSIGICLVGTDEFTEKQFDSLRRLLKAYKTMHKNATIHGHREFANKLCPGFDVQQFCKENCV